MVITMLEMQAGRKRRGPLGTAKITLCRARLSGPALNITTQQQCSLSYVGTCVLDQVIEGRKDEPTAA